VIYDNTEMLPQVLSSQKKKMCSQIVRKRLTDKSALAFSCRSCRCSSNQNKIPRITSDNSQDPAHHRHLIHNRDSSIFINKETRLHLKLIIPPFLVKTSEVLNPKNSSNLALSCQKLYTSSHLFEHETISLHTVGLPSSAKAPSPFHE